MSLLRKIKTIKFIPCITRNEIIDNICEKIFEQIIKKPNSVIGFVSEINLVDLYDAIVNQFNKRNVSFKDLIIIGTDEYMDIEQRYLKFSKFEILKKHLFKRTDINLDNVFFPDKNNYLNFDKKIKSLGGIDLLILVSGVNGQLCFNEPLTKLSSKTRVIKLENNTRISLIETFDEKINVPYYAIGIGLKTILSAKETILIASGDNISVPINKLFQYQYVSLWPITSLIYGKDVTTYADLNAAKLMSN